MMRGGAGKASSTAPRSIDSSGHGALMDGFVPVSRPHIWGDEKAKLYEAIEGGWVSSRGPFLDEFEDRFAAKIGTKYAVAASSGTAALHLALSVLDLENDDEVIVPDFTMISPVLAVLACGAIPVPVDADETWNMDVERIERAITDRTQAIVVVHTYGHPAKIDRIMETRRATTACGRGRRGSIGRSRFWSASGIVRRSRHIQLLREQGVDDRRRRHGRHERFQTVRTAEVKAQPVLRC